MTAQPNTAPVVLLGSAGAGMQAAAGLLRDLGLNYVGIDQATAPIDRPHLPWAVDSLPNQIHSCIYSAAVSADDAVLKAARQKADCLSLADFIASVFRDRQQICVAGTHGKTTTSAMLAWILKAAKRDPSWFIGANLADGQKQGHFGQGHEAVIESCEFQQTFLKYSPSMAVVTGIERDHFDCYPDQKSEDEAFHNFLKSVAGQLVINADCFRSQQLLPDSSEAIYFQVKSNTDDGMDSIRLFARPNAAESDTAKSDTAKSDTVIPATTILRRRISGSPSRSLTLRTDNTDSHHSAPTLALPMPGKHNLSNAAAAIAAALSVGVSIKDSVAALNQFPGVERRFQDCGTFLGARLIDDYAHHPTALKTTIQAARQHYPGRRIVAIFEPHQVSRTENLFADFVKSLKQADEVLLLPTFPARETVSFADCCRTSGKLVRALNAGGARAFLLANLDQTVARIEYSAKPSDVILTMGAGRTHLIHEHLHRRLQRHSVA